MTELRILRPIELRYVLTFHLFVHGPTTTADLVKMLDYWGFGTSVRPSKAIADCLRTEMERGRVFRKRRALYGPYEMPRGTEHRIRTRVFALRDETEGLRERRREAALLAIFSAPAA